MILRLKICGDGGESFYTSLSVGLVGNSKVLSQKYEMDTWKMWPVCVYKLKDGDPS